MSLQQFHKIYCCGSTSKTGTKDPTADQEPGWQTDKTEIIRIKSTEEKHRRTLPLPLVDKIHFDSVLLKKEKAAAPRPALMLQRVNSRRGLSEQRWVNVEETSFMVACATSFPAGWRDKAVGVCVHACVRVAQVFLLRCCDGGEEMRGRESRLS